MTGRGGSDAADDDGENNDKERGRGSCVHDNVIVMSAQAACGAHRTSFKVVSQSVKRPFPAPQHSTVTVCSIDTPEIHADAVHGNPADAWTQMTIYPHRRA